MEIMRNNGNELIRKNILEESDKKYGWKKGIVSLALEAGLGKLWDKIPGEGKKKIYILKSEDPPIYKDQPSGHYIFKNPEAVRTLPDLTQPSDGRLGPDSNQTLPDLSLNEELKKKIKDRFEDDLKNALKFLIEIKPDLIKEFEKTMKEFDNLHNQWEKGKATSYEVRKKFNEWDALALKIIKIYLDNTKPPLSSKIREREVRF